MSQYTRYPNLGAGSVTTVTASSPLASSGGATPNITIQNADATHAGVVTTGTQTFAGAKTLANDLTLGGNQIIAPKLHAYTEALDSLGSVSGAVTIDFSLANVHSLTLTGNVTLTFTNIPTTGQSSSATLWITQGNMGSYTVTWPASLQWAEGGAAPTLTTTIGKTDIISCATLNGGTTFAGFTGGLGFGL